jgi:hypothetical protein
MSDVPLLLPSFLYFLNYWLGIQICFTFRHLARCVCIFDTWGKSRRELPFLMAARSIKALSLLVEHCFSIFSDRMFFKPLKALQIRILIAEFLNMRPLPNRLIDK